MPAELWDLIKSYGMASPLVRLVLWLFFAERTDRKQAQADLKKVLEDQRESALTRAAVDHSGNQVIKQLISQLAAKEGTP